MLEINSENSMCNNEGWNRYSGKSIRNDFLECHFLLMKKRGERKSSVGCSTCTLMQNHHADPEVGCLNWPASLSGNIPFPFQ